MKNAFWPTVLSVAPMVHCCLSVCRLSVVFDVLYCGKTVHPSEKMSEVVKKLIFFGSPPYFYFRFRLYGYRDGRICHIFARTAQQSVLDVKIDLLAANHVRILSDCAVRIETGSSFSHDYWPRKRVQNRRVRVSSSSSS